MEYYVEKVEDLYSLDLERLVQESEKEGYRFVARLVNEIKDESNLFNRPGEGLFCVKNDAGSIIAIGGINQSPFDTTSGVGRLRRFYVAEGARREGVGTLLLQSIVEHAKKHFTEITVRTDSSKADAFYRACGFTFDDSASETTHFLILQ